MTEQELKLLNDLIEQYEKDKLEAGTEGLRKRFRYCAEGLKAFKFHLEKQKEGK